MTISNSLIHKPLYLPEDLGKPLPNSNHAVSVCLPTWEDVIAYEEQDERVIQALQCGYPRFVIHPFTQQLFDYCTSKFALDGELCFIFPSFKVAKRAVKFIENNSSFKCRIQDLGKYNLSCVLFPKEAYSLTKAYWQHTGEIISSRLSSQVFMELTDNSPSIQSRLLDQAEEAKLCIKQRIVSFIDESEENIFLYQSGMAAIYSAFNVVLNRTPGLKTLQFGFPYTDTIKIQQKFNANSPLSHDFHFLHNGDKADLLRLEEILQQEKIAGLFCEIPSNPLLQTPDWKRLCALSTKYDFPIVVDDTVGTFANLLLDPAPDMLVSSLTKYFSGQGDVMAGSLVISSKSRYFKEFTESLISLYDDLLWCQDAIILEQNSSDFSQRMEVINQTTETLCDFLREHPAIKTIYYPKYDKSSHFESLSKHKKSFGGLFSILLKNPSKASSQMFNALKVSKGPSLGTNYTIACPYTLLAHYQELDFVESCGVSRNLIRVSVGLEDAEDLIERFQKALSVIN